MAVPAIGLHEITKQNRLINPGRLIHLMMGAVRIFGRGGGGALTFMTPGTPGYQGIVLLNVKIHIGMGLERLFMVFIVGVIVGDMANNCLKRWGVRPVIRSRATVSCSAPI